MSLYALTWARDYLRRKGGAPAVAGSVLIASLVVVGCPDGNASSEEAGSEPFTTAQSLTYRDGSGRALEAAIPMWRELLRGARENGRTRSEGAHLANLGYTFAGLGQRDSAFHYFQMGLEKATAADHYFNATGILRQLAELRLEEGDTAGARVDLEAALVLLDSNRESDPASRARVVAKLRSIGVSVQE